MCKDKLYTNKHTNNSQIVYISSDKLIDNDYAIHLFSHL